MRIILLSTAAMFVFVGSFQCLAQSDTYQNPIDGKSYVAHGGWKTYSPEGGAPSRADKVSLAGVRLLQSQSEIGARTTPADMADFIERAHRAAAEVFAAYGKPATLLVQFDCTPQRCPAQIASQGDPPQDLLQAYYDKLLKLKPLQVSDEVRFQFTLDVKP